MESKKTSILVCFAGRNHRIDLTKKSVKINGKGFTCQKIYKADDGNQYLIGITSENGNTADVVVFNKTGKQVIASRKNVAVRFYKYLYI